MTEQGALNVGFGNRVLTSRLVAVLVPGSSPLRRLKQQAKEAGKLGNATHGRKCRSILLMDSGHVILSAVHPNTLCERLETVNCGEGEAANRALTSRIVAVFTQGSSSVNGLKTEAGRAGRLVDLTQGRKWRSVVLLDSGQILLSAVHPDTLCKRLPALSGPENTWPREV